MLKEVLDEFPSLIGMTKISPPHVYNYVGDVAEDWGVSGFVVIAESHISIHTFPDRQYLNIDIFSCKEFDNKGTLAKLQSRFNLTNIRSWSISRGLEHLNPPQGVELVIS
jgi:S-adenosylmethionine decarboxylase